MKGLTDQDKVCLRCGHLYIKTEDKSKRICLCRNPVLCLATRVLHLSISELKRLPKFSEALSNKGGNNDS